MKADLTPIVTLVAVLAPACLVGCSDEQSLPAGVQGGSTAAGIGGTATGGAPAGTSGSAGIPTGGVTFGGSSGTSASGSGSGLGGGAGAGAGGVGGSPAAGGQSGSSTVGGGPQGGMPPGGMSGLGGNGGRGGAGGAAGGSGGGSGGGCTKGQAEPSEVILIGDSFIALNHSITNQIESRARAAGALGQNEDYRDVAVSGATLAGNNQIPSQYTNAVGTSPVEVVLMDGGGNDCIRNDPSGALSAATSLFQTMGQNGTETVVYFFYPDPVGGNWASLKSCLDTLRPQVKSLCEGLTTPKCYFMDLRTVWQPSYAQSDGIHPTVEGGGVVGDAVWATMQQYCIAQ